MDNKNKKKEENVIANEVKQSDRNEEIATSQAPRNDEDVQQEEQKELEEHVYLKKVLEVEDKYKRVLADYQNLVRRTRDEKSEWARIANKELVLKLLPILDTLMLAEKHTKDQNFVLTVQQFLQVLKDEGFERIKAIGETFDPLLMEVVETRDGADDKVLEEVKAGFRSGEVILRPALVVVGKGK